MAEFPFPSRSGSELHVRTWETPGPPRAMVLLSHGYGEHVGRYEHVAAALTGAGCVVVAPDHHGHGRSGGPRGQIDFTDAVADLDALLTDQCEHHPALPVFLIGHSMGGAIAIRYAIAHQNRLTGLVLSGPLVTADVPAVKRVLGSLVAKLAPSAPTIKLDPKLVSRDPAVVGAYVDDPLVRHAPIAAGAAAEFIRHTGTVMADAKTITIPTLLLWGEADGLCPATGAEQLAESLGSPDLTTHGYPGLYHEIFNEPERDEVLATVVDWLTARI